MGAAHDRRPGRLTQWWRRATGQPPGGEPPAQDRTALLLAVAQAGLPLAPAAHPVGHRCSCARVGCPTPGRHPVSFAWQTQSTHDRGQIERWAAAEPEANFITATGMVHDVLDVPYGTGERVLARLAGGGDGGAEVGPVAVSDDGRMLFFTATRGTPEDEDEYWPCELDSHPESVDEHPGLRWHCRGSYVLVPPARLPGEGLGVTWLRGPEHPLVDPLPLLAALTDAEAVAAGTPGEEQGW
ncbi:bifunctional DNA primase/polymerase [Streptomyces sp. NPDC088923]|uniref:bifunctional DNA primase/polymerase n=1 Tax=Streptomyces sp. NPDC088923 TaxID=3365913 RepID=UPI003807BE03